jgi:phage replication O-like protein O
LKTEQPLASYNGKPQKEDGYTPIANELLEAILLADLSKRQLLVVMAIARMTFGYSKKADALSTVQIASMTGINRPKVSETLKELIEMNVVQKHDAGRMAHGFFVSEISINKHYKNWTATDTKLIPVDRCQNGIGYQNGTGTEMVPPTDTKLGTGQIPKRDTHKAIKTIKQISTKETSIPDDFSISERVVKWASEKGHKNLDQHLENFVLAAKAKNYKYSDWDSAFMVAIRKNWANVVATTKAPDWKKDLL